MNYQKNGIASAFKIYSIVNLCAALILTLTLDLAGFSILVLATALVASAGIYAIGEVIQLLDEIKQNTAGKQSESKPDANAAADTSIVVDTSTTEDGLVYSCPSCGARILVPGQKVCFSCGQVIKW